ncbi:hypothetical protein Bpro_3693 [Polaromonas sp. JS666]|nr:hypothetical protein Bpro_3693 [Polaromonas sp. JS666]
MSLKTGVKRPRDGCGIPRHSGGRRRQLHGPQHWRHGLAALPRAHEHRAVRPGDNLMIHKALMMVEPGDVLVIDAAAT